MREVADLAECPWNMRLSAGDEYAGSDNRVQRFASQKLFFVRALIQLLCDVANCFRQRKLVAPAGYVTECSEDVTFRTRILRSGGSPLKLPRDSGPPSRKLMRVSSCSMPSMRGSEAAPTREGSSPSSLANVFRTILASCEFAGQG